MPIEIATLMQRSLGIAVNKLRERRDWDQSHLAYEIHRLGRHLLAPAQSTISRWEKGQHPPSRAHLLALMKIARNREAHDLAEIFRAPASAWTLPAALLEAGILHSDASVRSESQAAGRKKG